MRYSVEASSQYSASASEIYRILADYRGARARILPRRFFPSVEVVEGGIGEGTRLKLRVKDGTGERPVWTVVAEPDPGRVLAETDLLSDTVTVYRVEDNDLGATVTISTQVAARSGLRGLLERLARRAYLRRVFAEELRLLSAALGESVAEAARRGREKTRERSSSTRWAVPAIRPKLVVGEGARSRFHEAP